MAEGFFEQLKKKNKAKGRLRKSKACTSVLIENGKKVVREVDYNSRQAVILQFRLLNELLKENQNTEYGKKYDFANIHSIEEYKKKVPFAEYDDLQPYIYEMMAGEKNVLSSEPPMYYATTTGSIGVPKHIPVSERELKKYNKYSVLMAFGVAEEYYQNTTGMSVPAGQGLNAIEMKVTPTKSGVNAGSISCTLMDSVKDIVPYLLSAPWEVINPGQEMDLKYLKTRLALQNKDLAFMDSVFLCGHVDPEGMFLPGKAEERPLFVPVKHRLKLPRNILPFDPDGALPFRNLAKLQDPRHHRIADPLHRILADKAQVFSGSYGTSGNEDGAVIETSDDGKTITITAENRCKVCTHVITPINQRTSR